MASFQPFALQKFGGTNLGQIAGYQQADQQMRAAEDPLALLKMLGGKGASRAYDEPYMRERAREMGMAGRGFY